MSDKLTGILLTSAGADLVEIRNHLVALAERIDDEAPAESAAARALAGWLDGSARRSPWPPPTNGSGSPPPSASIRWTGIEPPTASFLHPSKAP